MCKKGAIGPQSVHFCTLPLFSTACCCDTKSRNLLIYLTVSVTDQPASAITTSSSHFVKRSFFGVGKTVETISNSHSSAQVLKRMGHVLVCRRPPRIDSAACTGDVAPPPISWGFDGGTHWLSLQSTKLRWFISRMSQGLQMKFVQLK